MLMVPETGPCVWPGSSWAWVGWGGLRGAGRWRRGWQPHLGGTRGSPGSQDTVRARWMPVVLAGEGAPGHRWLCKLSLLLTFHVCCSALYVSQYQLSFFFLSGDKQVCIVFLKLFLGRWGIITQVVFALSGVGPLGLRVASLFWKWV